MNGKEMVNDINKAIASGGYAIVPEKAVDGTGRNAIYVYMTYDGQDGYQSWKISGGLNGGFLLGFLSGIIVGILVLLTIWAAGIAALAATAVNIAAVIIFLALTLGAATLTAYKAQQLEEDIAGCFMTGAGLGVSFSAMLKLSDAASAMLFSIVGFVFTQKTVRECLR